MKKIDYLARGVILGICYASDGMVHPECLKGVYGMVKENEEKMKKAAKGDLDLLITSGIASGMVKGLIKKKKEEKTERVEKTKTVLDKPHEAKENEGIITINLKQNDDGCITEIKADINHVRQSAIIEALEEAIKVIKEQEGDK